MAKNKNKYDEIRGDLDTGDIVLFSRRNCLMWLWKKLTKGYWTHVGIAIRSLDTDQVHLWESTPLKNLCDVQSNIAQGGVQVVLLSLRVQTYRGDVAIRKLRFKDDDNGTTRKEVCRRLLLFRDEVRGRKFDGNIFTILKAFIDIFKPKNIRNFRKNLTKIFCSELVAAAFMEARLLDKSSPAEEYTPKQFSYRHFPLELGASLGPIIRIKYKPKNVK